MKNYYLVMMLSLLALSRGPMLLQAEPLDQPLDEATELNGDQPEQTWRQRVSGAAGSTGQFLKRKYAAFRQLSRGQQAVRVAGAAAALAIAVLGIKAARAGHDQGEPSPEVEILHTDTPELVRQKLAISLDIKLDRAQVLTKSLFSSARNLNEVEFVRQYMLEMNHSKRTTHGGLGEDTINSEAEKRLQELNL